MSQQPLLCEPAPARCRKPLRVLVVDDDADTADSLATLLRLWGYEVHLALDGPTALQTAWAEEPDVVLLDVAMPRMDGWAVATRLRERPGRKRPVVVVVSGYGGREDRLRSRAADVDFHLVKPVHPDYLAYLLGNLQILVPASD